MECYLRLVLICLPLDGRLFYSVCDISLTLHLATSRNFVEATLFALKNGASMTVRNDARNTPLESAIDEKGIEVVKTICLFEHQK